MGRHSHSRFKESGLCLCVWHFRKSHRSDKCTTKESGQMGVREKWEFQTHSACDYRYIGPGHAVAILVCENTAALNTLTHRLLRPGAERQASSTTCQCDIITGRETHQEPLPSTHLFFGLKPPRSLPCGLTLLGRRGPLLAGLGHPRDRQQSAG